MYCRKCGKELDDEAVICPFCGVPTENYNAAAQAQAAPAPAPASAPAPAPAAAPAEKKEENHRNIAPLILGIIAAIAGIISGFVWMIIGGVEGGFIYVVTFFFLGLIGPIFALIGSILAAKNKISGTVLMAIGLLSQIGAVIGGFALGVGEFEATGTFFMCLGAIFATVLLIMGVTFSVIGVIKQAKQSK